MLRVYIYIVFIGHNIMETQLHRNLPTLTSHSALICTAEKHTASEDPKHIRPVLYIYIYRIISRNRKNYICMHAMILSRTSFLLHAYACMRMATVHDDAAAPNPAEPCARDPVAVPNRWKPRAFACMSASLDF